jgi:hypothetical protein
VSDTFPDTTTAHPLRRAKQRPCIPDPGSDDYWEPRCLWADGVGVTDRAARGLGLETRLIMGVAYVKHNASTQQLIEQSKRINAPQQRRGRHAR